MAVSFASTSGKIHDPVTINITALSATTQYIATITDGGSKTQRFEFTTDGAGAASFQFTPGTRATYTCSVAPKTQAATATSSNTYTGV